MKCPPTPVDEPVFPAPPAPPVPLPEVLAVVPEPCVPEDSPPVVLVPEQPQNRNKRPALPAHFIKADFIIPRAYHQDGGPERSPSRAPCIFAQYNRIDAIDRAFCAPGCRLTQAGLYGLSAMMTHPEDQDETIDTTLQLEKREGQDKYRPMDSVPALVDPTFGSLGAPISLDRYTLRKQIGKGAMGEVHLCKDNRIGRDLAMKVILPQAQSDAQARARFVREARVQGQLEHPAIVPVYDLGIDPIGAVFFTMKYLRGMTLAQVIRGLRNQDAEVVAQYPRRRLLAAFASACLAVDFAHSRGVVHRDLKPANIMLGDFGELYVLDWGIAKIHEPDQQGVRVENTLDEDVQTAAGKILGTFGYLAPEQALGRGTHLDKRSDIYSLGAILFELLTLEPLHRRGTWTDMLQSTLKGVSARASERAPDAEVPPELEAICVKATKLEPSDRYASARELHDVVERYLSGDRDTEVRKQLAEKHVQKARDAAKRLSLGGDGIEQARRAALQEVGKALVLDPTNPEAMRALGKIIAAPLDFIPREVELEMDAASAARRRLQLKSGMWANWIAGCLMLPFSIWMGWHVPWIVLLAVASTLAAAGMQLWGFRSKDNRRVHRIVYGAYLCNLMGLVLVGRAFGPLFFMPTLLTVLTSAYCMSDVEKYRTAVISAGVLALAGSAVLEWLGILSSSYSFHEGGMSVLPNAVMLPEQATLAGLLVAGLFFAIVPAVIIGNLQDALRDAEKRSLVNMWHLRQLLPEEVRGRKNQ